MLVGFLCQCCGVEGTGEVLFLEDFQVQKVVGFTGDNTTDYTGTDSLKTFWQ